MASKEVALDVASFLDSSAARALADVPPDDVRKIAELFVDVCYEGLGKKPRLLDGEDMRTALRQILPARLGQADPLAEHVPAVITAYLDHLEGTEVVTQAYEIRTALQETAAEFLETVRSGELAHRASAPRDPFVHGAPKLGRNAPCSCGSGKKYKKCHGK